MGQQVQELINKIKTEGIQEAEQKADEIKRQAQKRAEEIVSEAKQRAGQMIEDARQEGKKIEESTHRTLQQASRDMLLNLRKEIQETLMRIISSDINGVLTPENLTELIRETIKGYFDQDSAVKDITVTLSPKDLKKLGDGFIAKLQGKIKQPVTLQSADDINSGFTISFDQGKSFFDFTDASLAEYLGSYLNSQVSSLLKESSPDGSE